MPAFLQFLSPVPTFTKSLISYATGMVSRPYCPEDLEAVCIFLSNHGKMHPGDFVWRILQHVHYQPGRDVWLWEQSGEVVGLCLQKRDFFDVEVSQDLTPHQRLGLVQQIAEHAQAHTRVSCDKPPSKITTTTLESNKDEQHWLNQLGFQQDNFVMYFNSFNLDQAIAKPDLSEGFAVRHPEEHELKERVDVHRKVWHPSRFSLQGLLNLRATLLYRPELDLVAVSPQGRFASYAIIWYDPLNKVGEFEPVGTRKAFRGLGLGKAVLLEGFRRLKQLGAEKAIVYCMPDTLKFYQSAGFQAVDKWLDYSKKLEVKP